LGNTDLFVIDEATDKTTQFWLRAKAQAIIDSHSTDETTKETLIYSSFPRIACPREGVGR